MKKVTILLMAIAIIFAACTKEKTEIASKTKIDTEQSILPCPEYNLNVGGGISNPSIGQLGSANGVFYVHNKSATATTGIVEVFITGFPNGTMTFPNLPAGITQMTTTGYYTFNINQSILPQVAGNLLQNAISIPFTYTNTSQASGMLTSSIRVSHKNAGEVDGSDNVAGTFILIN